MCVHCTSLYTQAKTALLNVTLQLHRYVAARAPLVPLAKTSSLTFDLLHGYSSYQMIIVSSTRFQHHLGTALKGEETTDGMEEAEVLGSLATALQATTKMMNAAEGEREEREAKEIVWRTGVLRELMALVIKDATWSVLRTTASKCTRSHCMFIVQECITLSL